MANSDSSLAKPMLISRHFNAQKSKKVLKITPHHAAGVGASLAGMKQVFETRNASANYGIDNKGNIALYVHEKDRAWTSSNSQDASAITIEIANSKGAPNWEVSDAAVKALINLSVDICKRNGMPGITYTGNKSGTLTEHRMFKATLCPGPYLHNLMPWIAKEVSGRVAGTITGEIVIPKQGSKTPATKPNTNPTVPAGKTTETYIYNGVDLSPVFDSKYYVEHYADLRNVFGYDDRALFNHFCQCGMKEARQGIATFNPVRYRQIYPDLNNAYADNWVKYYAHYCINGIKEGRKGV